MSLKKAILIPKITLSRVGVTSGASRAVLFYKNELPLQLKHKKLLKCYKWNAGRAATGRIVAWAKGKKTTRHRTPSVNYQFRQTNLGFVGGLLLRPLINKLLALLFMASGSVMYVPTSTKHQIFRITQFRSVFTKKSQVTEQLKSMYPHAIIDQYFFLIKQLPKNKAVSLLEILPGKGVQYVRSTGTAARIVKMDSRISTSLVKLPSGVKKVFSTHSIGSVGPVSLPENKKWRNNSAGFYRKFGKKSKVRGVAMNPVDHPHGGRAKAIRYQRTPWGKTTKYK